MAAAFVAASCAILRHSSDRQHHGCPLFKTGFRPRSRHLRSRPSSTGRRRGAHLEGSCSAPCLVGVVRDHRANTANAGASLLRRVGSAIPEYRRAPNCSSKRKREKDVNTSTSTSLDFADADRVATFVKSSGPEKAVMRKSTLHRITIVVVAVGLSQRLREADDRIVNDERRSGRAHWTCKEARSQTAVESVSSCQESVVAASAPRFTQARRSAVRRWPGTCCTGRAAAVAARPQAR